MNDPVLTSVEDTLSTNSSSTSRIRQPIQVIEWNMMDKQKFIPLAMSCSVTIRAFLYPLTVVKTRLQIQRQSSVYKGTFDAIRKIHASEGITGLYRGYWINTFQIFSSVAYVYTYERMRHILNNNLGIESNAIRGLVGGACGSAVSQTIIVPFDIISQHMMILGNRTKVTAYDNQMASDPLNLIRRLNSMEGDGHQPKSRAALSRLVIREIFRQDGLRGFYRGYMASLICYCPNSAGFWGFYHLYAEWLKQQLEQVQLPPPWTPNQLVIQCAAAPMAGLSTTVLTNPLDLLRARLQVQRTSFSGTLSRLWMEEGSGIFSKGLSARLISSSVFSFSIILCYESLKRFSVSEEYKESIVW